jgi:hypothetical protein
VSDIVGWLALTVVSGLVLAVGSFVDWKAVLSKYFGIGDDDQQ